MGYLAKRKTKEAVAKVTYTTTATLADILAASDDLVANAPTATEVKSLRYVAHPRLVVGEVDEGVALVYQVWVRKKKDPEAELERGRDSLTVLCRSTDGGISFETVSYYSIGDALSDMAANTHIRRQLFDLIMSVDPNAVRAA